VLVPRHPQRFDQVAELLAREGVTFVRRSAGLPQHDTAVWLGDSMGEMVAYYTLAEVAFIGGSLLPLGGQNLIEAAACGCPVVVGPHTFNFLQATVDAIAAGAAARVEDAEDVAETISRLFGAGDELERMRLAAASFAAAHAGATARTLELIRVSLSA
jgi:3-deoxy-D-manno-octulosonic-acid transferase